MYSLCSNWWNMEHNSAYIRSEKATRHIKTALQRQLFSLGQQRKKNCRKMRKKTSVICLTTMSFEPALAITNQKTIKDEDKDKLRVLRFVTKMIANELECYVCRRGFTLSLCVCWRQWEHVTRVCVCLHVRACFGASGELASGHVCVIMYVRPSWMVCLRQSGVWSSSGWTKLETEKQTLPRNPRFPPPPIPPSSAG